MAKSFKDKKGYRRWKNSKKLFHRTVAEKKIGGKIGIGRVVHLKDGNKQNNRPSNLRVMSRSEHSSLHAKKRRWFWQSFDVAIPSPSVKPLRHSGGFNPYYSSIFL